MSSSMCFHCKKNTASRDVKVSANKNGSLSERSTCATCGYKKHTFVKKQTGKGLFDFMSKSGLPVLGEVGNMLNGVGNEILVPGARDGLTLGVAKRIGGGARKRKVLS
jgi:hypothetical protein